jgi:hypothetical protein
MARVTRVFAPPPWYFTGQVRDRARFSRGRGLDLARDRRETDTR